MVHATIVLAFALLLGSGHRHLHEDEPSPPARLVWIEPAPPAPPRAEAPASVPVMPAAPVVVPPSVERKIAPTRVVTPPKLDKRGTARAASAAPPPPAEEARNEAANAPVSDAAAVPSSGVATGIVGGTAGGLGDAPLALAAVATPPELLERVVPEYPPRARALEVEGQVVLEVVLDRRGTPEPDIRVLRSVALLDAAAIAAVRQWRFRPARDAAGKPVRVIMEVPVRFVLR